MTAGELRMRQREDDASFNDFLFLLQQSGVIHAFDKAASAAPALRTRIPARCKVPIVSASCACGRDGTPGGCLTGGWGQFLVIAAIGPDAQADKAHCLIPTPGKHPNDHIATSSRLDRTCRQDDPPPSRRDRGSAQTSGLPCDHRNGWWSAEQVAPSAGSWRVMR
jgi:hypothetical protein